MNKLIIALAAVGGIIVLFIAAGTIILTSDFKWGIPTPVSEYYISCGCGCCGGFDKPLEEIARVECLYPADGETLQDKINQDNQLSPELCATAGCGFPIKYVYCE